MNYEELLIELGETKQKAMIAEELVQHTILTDKDISKILGVPISFLEKLRRHEKK